MSVASTAKEIGPFPEVDISIPENTLRADESILFDMPSTLGPDGEQILARVLVTNQRILLFEAVDGIVVLREEYKLDDIRELQAQGMVGNGRLVAWIGDQAYCIARYAMDHQPLYSAAANYVTRYAEDRIIRPVDDIDLNVCMKCGRPLNRWTGLCPVCLDKGKIAKRLWELMKPHMNLMIPITILFWVITGVNLLLPQLQRILVDDILQPQLVDLRFLVIIVGGMALGRLLNVLLNIWRGRLMVKLSSQLGKELRETVFAKIQALSLRYIDERRTGDLMNRISGDTRHIQSFLQNQIPNLINQTLIFIGIGYILFRSNWKLAILVLVPGPLIVWYSRVTWRMIRNLFRKQRRLSDRANSLLQDIFSGIRVVKAFGREDREIARFDDHTKKLARQTAYNEKMFSTIYPSMGFVMGLGHFLILYFGGHLVYGRELLLGELILFSTYAGMIYQPLRQLTHVPRWFHQAMTALERIFDVIDQEPDVVDKPDALPMPDVKGHIVLKDVTFGYIKHEPVLRNINVEIKEGEMIGLVGHSGAGKSTLINLINRFYDVDEGEILIDGINVKDISQKDLRRQIGVVLQDTFLFSGTIWENIAYAKPDATPEEIIRAAKVANAHDFIIKFPDGYDTKVGERGQRLSGGERQRIAIARAVLHNPRILIMDEATSSVDSHTEKAIQEAIQRLVANRTTIAIAHRLSTLRYANRIMVLDHGRLVEMGTHDELMRLKGTYYRLVMAQRELANMQAV